MNSQSNPADLNQHPLGVSSVMSLKICMNISTCTPGDLPTILKIDVSKENDGKQRWIFRIYIKFQLYAQPILHKIYFRAITHICSRLCPCQFAAAHFELYVQPCMLQRHKATELPNLRYTWENLPVTSSDCYCWWYVKCHKATFKLFVFCLTKYVFVSCLRYNLAVSVICYS